MVTLLKTRFTLIGSYLGTVSINGMRCPGLTDGPTNETSWTNLLTLRTLVLQSGHRRVITQRDVAVEFNADYRRTKRNVRETSNQTI